IDRIPGGKRFQGSWLLLPGGRALLLSYRPIPEHFDLVGKRVVATGRHYSNPPHIQQISADHFELHAIKPAPGVSPITPKPDTLPIPDRVRDASEFRAMLGRWVQVTGTLRGPAPEQDGGFWIDIQLAMEDGTILNASVPKSRYE
ncbi:unnamed protein product, partial [Laminaria digitata]